MVVPHTGGSYRNHCPLCLFSKHVDLKPGDRANPCRGLMAATGLDCYAGKGFQVVHECLSCGATRVNKVAQDTGQPDEIDVLKGLFPR